MKKPPNLIVFACSIVGLLPSAGCVSYQIAQLKKEGWIHTWDRSDAARALRHYVGDRRATDALIAALSDPQPTVRYVAAESLETHLIPDTYHGYAGPLDSTLRNACEALIARLNDDERGRVRWHYYWWMGVWADQPTAPVRYRAAMTLCRVLNADRGFDAAAWRPEIERALHRREVARKEPTPASDVPPE